VVKSVIDQMDNKKKGKYQEERLEEEIQYEQNMQFYNNKNYLEKTLYYLYE
jgi:hypothetical protein